LLHPSYPVSYLDIRLELPEHFLDESSLEVRKCQTWEGEEGVGANSMN